VKRPKHTITWQDAGREPQCAPNPLYPKGIDVDLSTAGEPACKVDLPYPAKRVGGYVVTCSRCGICVGTTTAGRPDDPRSINIPCKEPLN
jgi:hypothetical protein